MSLSLAAAVDSADAPLYLPYKTLVSTLSSMVFSEGEAHRLIEILSEKTGIIQDTWHTVWKTALGDDGGDTGDTSCNIQADTRCF